MAQRGHHTGLGLAMRKRTFPGHPLAGNIDLTATQMPITEIYEMGLTNGTTGFVTRHDTNLIYATNTYVSTPIKRGPIVRGIDLKYNPVSITMGLFGITLGGLSVRELVVRQYFDNATFKITQVDYTNLGATGRLIFNGFITGGINYDQGVLKFILRDLIFTFFFRRYISP